MVLALVDCFFYLSQCIIGRSDVQAGVLADSGLARGEGGGGVLRGRYMSRAVKVSRNVTDAKMWIMCQ